MSKAKEFIRESSNVKSVLKDYIDQLNKLENNLRQEYREVSDEIKKVVVDLDQVEDFSKVPKIISRLDDAQSDLDFYSRKLRTVLMDLGAEV